MSQGPLIVAFTGKIGSGKSTAAELLFQAWPEEPGKKVKMYAFAGPLKDAMKAAFGFTDAQLYGEEKEVVDPRYGVTPRHVLQRVGTEWFRDRLATDIGVKIPRGAIEGFSLVNPPGLWVERFRQYVVENQKKASLIIVEDCRFADEAEAIHDLGGIIIRLLTPEDEKMFEKARAENTPSLHASEQGSFDVDAVILNEKRSKIHLLANVFEVLGGIER